MSRPRVGRSPVSFLIAGLLALGACAKAPPPDLDATPAGATPLKLRSPRQEILTCGKGDCADWYRLEVPSAGRLVIDVEAKAAHPDGDGLSVSLTDSQGASLAHDQAAGRTALVIAAEVRPAPYLIAVASNDREAVFEYQLAARIVRASPPRRPTPVIVPTPVKRAPPPPPPPRFEVRRAEVLEVDENGPGGRAVLLDAGTAQGLRVGLRGRLLDGGRTVGTLEIVAVYLEGCLARVEGSNGAAISPSSVAEIDLPLGSAPTPR